MAKLDVVPYDEDEVTGELRYVQVRSLTPFYQILVQILGKKEHDSIEKYVTYLLVLKLFLDGCHYA